MKKILNYIFLTFVFLFVLVSCDNNNGTKIDGSSKTQTIIPEESTTDAVTPAISTGKAEGSTTATPSTTAPSTKPVESSTEPSTTTITTTIEEIKLQTNKSTTIYLAGDSTVKTYTDKQYIGGWGQYLSYFLADDVQVVNCAQGGRSSRSFINEGRLYNIEGNNYSFSENGGKSIEDCIKEGDFLFIQFGHNDDNTKMSSSYATVYDRMVPLGEKDENGIYPTTKGERVSTSNDLPSIYTSNVSASDVTKAKAEILKYGDSYYSYDCGGTYKWYLKQYIDFARENGAIPVLVTPVARVKYSGDTIIGGAGLHGENFAYVEAVRQLAKEEDCLLIDLFLDTKTILETATSSYGNYLMALKPNDLTGQWPSGYDETYNNAALGYTGIEATHYNKYGAYITAGFVAENIINEASNITVHNENEYFSFSDFVLKTPKAYIDPSNLISKKIVSNIEKLYTNVNVTNPNRIYNDPALVVAKINEVCTGEVTTENYLTYSEALDTAYSMYLLINIDDRANVTNYSLLTEYQDKVNECALLARPKPIKTVVLDASDLAVATYNAAYTYEGFTIVASSAKAVDVKSGNQTATVNGETISTTKYISMGGAASYGTTRYIEFSVEGSCTITVVAKSTGSDDRNISIVKSGTTTSLGSFSANQSVSVTSIDISDAGTYQIGSTNKGVYIYYILIEYFK